MIEIVAEVSKQSLKLLSMEDEKKVKCIAFGSTYYGCDVLKSYVLYNHSPKEVSFVVILEEDAEGQEVVSVFIIYYISYHILSYFIIFYNILYFFTIFYHILAYFIIFCNIL